MATILVSVLDRIDSIKEAAEKQIPVHVIKGSSYEALARQFYSDVNLITISFDERQCLLEDDKIIVTSSPAWGKFLKIDMYFVHYCTIYICTR